MSSSIRWFFSFFAADSSSKIDPSSKTDWESRVEDGVSGSLRSIATTIHLKHQLRCGARGQLYMGMNLDS
ncbi:hypothetical protein HanXRQr2_Chr09g0409141 [Helianthus annuus]|uniref:Uncharacterized protein n=1 Tax=Helianthus annuus TaxID=4232 RepID=A0A251U072_HELAN|nr:hypothetical protein HanXRQr2_Chr09g0409141 [Helianthus annuus]KAJ0527635.1 hypothetical protein HanHA300_Chr09g0336161 [Helianthus annuus]KAJ0544046.1 hypothetical protein HanHA89_Chr09g0357251 [Helianthus annuus]KAJ0712965.1 hypothetical protein HanOQP8_Chr09g0340581 [Helianthus annuus]